MNRIMKVTTAVLFVCCMAITFNAHATARTWIGGASGSWSNPNNWSPTGIPVPNTTAGDDIIFDGSGMPTVTITDYPAVSSTNFFGQFTAQNNVTLNISGAADTYLYFATGVLINTGSIINIGASTTTIFSFGLSGAATGPNLIYGTLEFKGTGTNQTTNRKELKANTFTGTQVFGKVIFSGPAAVLNSSSTATFIVKAGGEMQWARDGVAMPPFAYDNGGIINVTGVTTTNFILNNFGNYLGIIKWNCPLQTSVNIELVPSVGPLVFHIDSAVIINTGTGSLCMGLQPSYSIGHLEVQGGTVTLGKATAAQTSALITSDLKITGGTVTGNSTFSGDATSYPLTLTVTRDFIMTGGSFDLTNRPTGNSPGGAMQMNVGRHFLKTGGTITATSAFGSQNDINLNGTSSQDLQFDNLGTGAYAISISNSSTTLGVNLLSNTTMPSNVPLILASGAVWLNNYDLSVPYNIFFRFAGTPIPRVYTNGFGKLKLTGVPASATVTFPVSALASNSYEPLVISPTASAGTHDYWVRVQYGNSPTGIYSPAKTIQRTWTINASPSAPAYQVGLIFQYHDTTKGSSCTPTAIMEEGHFAGAAWNVDPAGQLTPSGSNPYTVGPFYPGGLDSSFVIGNQASILALTDKIQLQLAVHNGTVQMQWHPGNLSVAYDYYVERSTDAITFTTLSHIGNDQFTFTDVPATAAPYYRVKAIAPGGSVLYSNIEKTTGMQRNDVLRVYPSPAKNETAVYINSSNSGTALLCIIDVNGHMLYTRNVIVAQGVNRLPVNLSAMPAGIYQVKCLLNGTQYLTRMVKE